MAAESRSYDAIVIGVGAMGAATCRALASRGARVLGLERFDLCHDRGSSHGRSRVVRKAYFEDPRYVPLLHAAYALWRELASQTGEEILHRTGCLNLGPADHECVRGARQSAEEHALPHEVLTAAEVRARWPVLDPAEGDVGIYEADAGFVVPERCVRLLADEARRRGAELREREPVRRWSSDGPDLAVATERATYRCRQLVVAAGPWLGRIPGPVPLELPLRVERQVQLWFRPRGPERFRAGRLPVLIHFLGGRAYYAVPASADDLFKVARHHGGETAEPDAVRRRVTAADEADVRSYLRRHVPEADAAPAASEVCLYTNTPDDHFVIDRHPGREDVFVAGGFSGHGFKFAPLVGEIVADLMLQGRTRHPVELFSARRFER
jgi:sarcosine oxidase